MNAYVCCDEKRRAAVAASTLNGIDYLEVLDADAPTPADRQRILRVHFLKPAPPGLTPANVIITGGDRITGVSADDVSYGADAVVVHLNAYGDFSTYRLQFVAASGSAFNPASLDPQLSFVDFSFKAACSTEFDPARRFAASAPPPRLAPNIDYLAKDYNSFRQLMLDRLSTVAPRWTERNPADLGVALVELFAHVGDLLSYRQDAVATEAYLGTARRRVSVRRHARLVDYFLHEGVNARAFLHFEVDSDVVLKQGAQAYTAMPGQAARLAPGSDALARVPAMGPETFETMEDATLFAAHNRLSFHTFGDGRCRLPAGATSATLKGSLDKLKVGDVLIFQEALNPRTGHSGDADPARRWAVRLTKVTLDQDPIGGSFLTPPIAGATPITRIEWSRDDATPFAFPFSASLTSNGVAKQLDDVTVAFGNIVLADHGASFIDQTLGEVPAPKLFRPPSGADPCTPGEPTPIPARYRPRLRGSPLVHAAPYDPLLPPPSAAATLRTKPEEATPPVALTELRAGQQPAAWKVRRDLLASEAEAADFVVETESDGSTYLRFGDDVHGQRPPQGATFEARYRVGEATRGNVAADAISHVVSADPAIRSVRNPLPAQGGVAPESMEHARRAAPIAFRVQRRAVTAEDYETLAETHPEVLRAAAAFRWTGSWSTVFVTVERRGGAAIDADFANRVRVFLEPYRLAGHDLQVNGPKYVALEIEMRVIAKPDHFRSDIEQALMAVFSSGLTPDGGRGVFSPDKFVFGQAVYLSPLYAVAQAVDGVAAAQVTKFQRRGRPDARALVTGKLDMARLEIARLDNDPDFPERGVFRAIVEGGK
ncbi:putative baseplate assembly protein [Methylocapsa polymorpha]|uniref:Baseplate assembly protein n=1 Tax=Methylocapsa polymorpha TaxID=3080828 RepID=A0ABZ0HVR6_9HYPH|nr:putative baseplate assembly protein [Methylocapsa sp. RX1]